MDGAMTFLERVKSEYPESTDGFADDYGKVVRNQLLAASDWTQTVDNPTGDASAWATYRQQLRDAPQDPNWPNVQIPSPPA